MLTAPLENSLIRLDQELTQGSLDIFILVRFAFVGEIVASTLSLWIKKISKDLDIT